MVPDHSGVVLLLIDVINDLEWPDADKLLPFALPMAQRIRDLKARVTQANIPTIYVNDNFGQWRSDARAYQTLSRRRCARTANCRTVAARPR